MKKTKNIWFTRTYFIMVHILNELKKHAYSKNIAFI